MRGFVQANWNWQSDINYAISGDPGTIQKAYGLLGGRLGVSAPDKAWSVALYASNLLDKRYAAQITPSPVTALNPGGYVQYFQSGLRAPGRDQPGRRLLGPARAAPLQFGGLGTRPAASARAAWPADASSRFFFHHAPFKESRMKQLLGRRASLGALAGLAATPLMASKASAKPAAPMPPVTIYHLEGVGPNASSG